VPSISSIPIRNLPVLTLKEYYKEACVQRDRSAALPAIRMLRGRKLAKS